MYYFIFWVYCLISIYIKNFESLNFCAAIFININNKIMTSFGAIHDAITHSDVMSRASSRIMWQWDTKAKKCSNLCRFSFCLT